MLKEVWCHQQQEGNSQRADNAGQLSPGAGGFGHGGAGATAADREALKKSGRKIGGSEPNHLLVGIDTSAGSCRIGTREHAGIGERHQGDGEAANQHWDDIGVGDPRDREPRQALWEGAEDRHVVMRREVQHSNDGRRSDDGNQNARQALAALEQHDHRQRTCPDHKRCPVRFPPEYRLGDGP